MNDNHADWANWRALGKLLEKHQKEYKQEVAMEWLAVQMEKEMVDNHLNTLYTNTNYNRNNNDITDN
jgi:hypothetical protein